MADFPSPLLLIEDESAPVMLHCIMRNVGTTRFATKFPNKSRLACLDGHPSNRRAERCFEQVRPGWLSWLFHCMLHLIALVLKAGIFVPCRVVCKGLLYTSLVVGHGESMNVFRMCLYEEIVSTLHICVGAPSAAANRFRNRMIDMFSRVSRDSAARW